MIPRAIFLFVLSLATAFADPAVTGFTLIDTATQKEAGAIADGAEIKLAAFTIRADVSGDTASAEFKLTGAEENSRVESTPPFTLAGDKSGVYAPAGLAAGKYVLTVTPYAQEKREGAAGPSRKLAFSVREAAALIPIKAGELKDVPLKNPRVVGTPHKNEPIAVLFEGPKVEETSNPNPFRDYRLEVQFLHESEGIRVQVPGHFAGDGNAAETSAAGGNQWRAYFVPEIAGVWRYWVSFKQGTNAAIADVKVALNDFVEPTGRIEVADGPAPGFLRRNGHLLQFSGSGEYFLKGGADSPENFLAFADFDGTKDLDEKRDFLHRYEPHVRDWKDGDPTWKDGKGKGIIGALNYLSGKGMNSVYFLPYNIDGGDGNDTWPWSAPDVRDRFDVSKLDQWEIVFRHMDRKGIAMHVVLGETENDQALDGGSLGPNRRLYYRELVSRFAHHFGVVWNLGEENTNTVSQQKAFCDEIKRLDPYDHPIVLHTYPGAQERVYKPLLGFKNLDGLSLQMGRANAETAKMTREWIRRSREAGAPWFVCHDETGPADRGADADDAKDNNHAQLRREVLWGNLMSGGGGVEWYFGYKTPHHDLICEDWRSRDRFWDMTRHALTFFRQVPFWEMEPADELLADRGELDRVLRKKGTSVVYLSQGREMKLDLSGESGALQVRWYNPRLGGELIPGAKLMGGSVQSLGAPPDAEDWAALVTNQ